MVKRTWGAAGAAGLLVVLVSGCGAETQDGGASPSTAAPSSVSVAATGTATGSTSSPATGGAVNGKFYTTKRTKELTFAPGELPQEWRTDGYRPADPAGPLCGVELQPAGYVAFDNMHYTHQKTGDGLGVRVSLWNKPVSASVVSKLRAALKTCRSYGSESDKTAKVNLTPLTLASGQERAVAWKGEQVVNGKVNKDNAAWFAIIDTGDGLAYVHINGGVTPAEATFRDIVKRVLAKPVKRPEDASGDAIAPLEAPGQSASS